MDYKGFLSIDFLFIFFLILIIATAFLYYGENSIRSGENIESNIEGRIFLDKIANLINQVSSNGPGYSKTINLPNNISDKSYLLIVKSNKIILEYGNKRGTSSIFPVHLINNENLIVDEIKLYNGNIYLIERKDEGKLKIKGVS